MAPRTGHVKNRALVAIALLSVVLLVRQGWAATLIASTLHSTVTTVASSEPPASLEPPAHLEPAAGGVGSGYTGAHHPRDEAARRIAPASTAEAPAQVALPHFTTGWKRTLPAHIAATAHWFERERSLDELFVDVPSGGTVWMTFANSAFEDLCLNWAGHVYRLQKERSAIIAALDPRIQQVLRRDELPSFGFFHNEPGMDIDLRSNVTGFRR